MKTLIWFRNDLRTTDHEPLKKASESGSVVGLYCFDPRMFEQTKYGFVKTDSHRAQFLIESVRELGSELVKLGSQLIVRVGKPEEIVPLIIENHQFDRLYFHGEVTSEETTVEEKVTDSISVDFQKFWGNTMYHRDDLPFDLLSIPDVFTNFRKKVEKYSSVRKPVPKPELLIGDDKIEIGEIPAIEDLGLKPIQPDDRSVLMFRGGENRAWLRLKHYLFESEKIKDYKYTRNGLLGADYSSKFSPWLAHGCISARSIHHEVEMFEERVHKNVSTYWMKFELIWRDYFRYSAIKYGDQIFKQGGIQGKKLNKKTDSETFNKWAEGRTGIPFVDANMRELNTTGYMSNRGRQNAASFLAQNLDFDWRWGAAYFESKLIDYDVCSNWGNWAYNATVGHDPRNRYFNILNQADKYDKKGEYVRRWLPELRLVPQEFVHEPDKMSVDQQALNEVEIGKDYPKPMIDLEKSYEMIRSRD